MKIRDSRFELLRIISMIMIIAHHYSVHGGFEYIYGIHANNMILDFLYLGGKIGVVLFVLISGYHLIHSTMTLNKVFLLEFEILFYSTLFAVIFYFIPYHSIVTLTIQEVREACFPILHNQYWFATTYMILYLTIPFLNKLLLHLTQSEYIKFLLLQFIFCSILPTFMGFHLGIGPVLLFIFLYLIGAYLKLYPIHTKRKSCFITASFLYLFLFLTTLCFEYLASFHSIYSFSIYRFASESSILIIFCSIAIFEFFKNSKIKNALWINRIASTTFGIYLIHDNMYVRQFLWTTFFQNATFYQSNRLVLHIIFCILLVFTLCSLIEFLRKSIIEKRIQALIHKHYGKFKI